MMLENQLVQPEVQRQSKKLSYAERTRLKYAKILGSEELKALTPLQLEFMRERWLEQIIWFSKRSGRNRSWFQWVRGITIVFSVLAPFLISLGSYEILRDSKDNVVQSGFEKGIREGNSLANDNYSTASVELIEISEPFQMAQNQQESKTSSISKIMFYSGLVLSQVVAILAAIEQFFKFGDRWRHYRRTAEVLKSHGWQFFQLSGPYSPYAKVGSYKEAFSLFAAQVEEIIQNDVEGYVSQIAIQKSAKQDEEDKKDDK